MTLKQFCPRDVVRQSARSCIEQWRQARCWPSSKDVTGLLLTLLLLPASNAGAHTVVYGLSGNFVVPFWNPESAPPPAGTTFTGTFAFDGHSEPIPHEDPSWFWFRPASKMELDMFGHNWKSLASASCGEIDMKAGSGGISWGCTLRNEIGESGRVYMYLMLTFYAPEFQEPYPLGPFTPENFRENEIWSGFRFSTRNYEARGSVTLDDVRFISEPGVAPLCGAIAGALFIVRRARYRGTRALPAH